MVLRMFAAHHRHEDTRFTNNDQLSLEKLQLHDVEYHDAVTHGLKWEILSSEVMTAFPNLPGLIQLTCNTSGQLQRKETELQLCLRVYRAYLDQKAAKSVVGFNDVKKLLLKSKPEFKEYLPDLFNFVMKFSGGDTAPFLHETVDICAAWPRRVLGHEFWEAINFQPSASDHLGLFFCVYIFVYTYMFLIPRDFVRVFSTRWFECIELVRKESTIGTDQTCSHSVGTLSTRETRFPFRREASPVA